MGVDLIVGAHPHRIQGFEIYNGKPIIYSLGNFLFAQNVYRNGRLRFPEFCNLEMAFEYKNSGDHLCHFFKYNRKKQSLFFWKTENLLSSEILKNLSDFSSVPLREYNKWFKKNRYHKKLIPVYTSSDSKISIFFKDSFNFFRTYAINTLIKLNLLRVIKRYV